MQYLERKTAVLLTRMIWKKQLIDIISFNIVISYLTINEWGWVSEYLMEIEEGVAASTDDTLRDLHNSSYDTKAEFNNCFIIHSK